MSIPWHRKQTARIRVQPLEVFSFGTNPGPGSEWAGFGLARYPAEIEVDYIQRTMIGLSPRSQRTVAPDGHSITGDGALAE